MVINGYDELPAEMQRKLLGEAISKMGSAASLRQCTRALEKLDGWLRDRVGRQPSYGVSAALVLWFLYEFRVEGTSDAWHVSEYLRGGLVFAKLHF